MKTKYIKTIDITTKEWFDKINGNSYFSSEITINFNKKNQKTIFVPFTYGYGSHSEHVCFDKIKKELNCFKAIEENTSYWSAYKKYKIVYRYNKIENCLKRDLIK